MWNSTLDNAYIALDIPNGASLADEDVGVAYYKVKPLGRDALEFIATARKSRFLRFLATIGEHLNDKNVAVLARKTFATSSEPGNVCGADLQDEALPSGELSMDRDCESCEGNMELDAFGEHYLSSEDWPSQPRSPSTPEATFSSSDGMNADSDFSEEVCGGYFDPVEKTWRCEECNTALVDEECPNGHELGRCQTCGWELDNGLCQRCLDVCATCGAEMVHGQCNSCGEGEGSEDEDTITFDEKEGLWRCIYCHWEVEADNDTDGNCHCLNDDGEAHFIDLSECPDYEPADSCSSEDDPTDSEPNSDDEDFIDDTEIPMDAIALDAVIEIVDLATSYPSSELPETPQATEVMDGTESAKDMENIAPTDRSDDIEVVDAPAATDWATETSE